MRRGSSKFKAVNELREVQPAASWREADGSAWSEADARRPKAARERSGNVQVGGRRLQHLRLDRPPLGGPRLGASAPRGRFIHVRIARAP